MLNAEQRRRVEDSYMRVLRCRFPGRVITPHWNEGGPVGDRDAATLADDDDGLEEAADAGLEQLGVAHVQ